MRQRVEIEARRLGMAAQFAIGAFVGAIGHLGRRQVGQARDRLVDLLAQLGGFGCRRRLGLPAALDLAQ